MNTLIRISNRINLEKKLRFLSILQLFKNFIPTRQMLIFSDPRGGSTWLAEMLKTTPNTTIIWEPLNINHVKELRDFNFGWRQYIPEEKDWPELKHIFNNILSGKILNEWTTLKTSIGEYYMADRLIIKFCRGNMLIPWITRQFEFFLLPIYLVRHPFSVVSSQLKQGGWNAPFNKFIIPDMPFNEVYANHESFLQKLNSKEEALVAHWCITNSIPLNHPKNNINWITIYYEDLLINPESELKKIFKKWKITFPDKIRKKYRVKSSTTLDNNEANIPEYQLTKWKKDFSGDQIKKMEAVLEYFGIQHYNAVDVNPLIKFDKYNE